MHFSLFVFSVDFDFSTRHEHKGIISLTLTGILKFPDQDSHREVVQPKMVKALYRKMLPFEKLSNSRLALRQLNTVPLAFDKWEPRNIETNNPPILILHGLFGSKINNRSVARALAREQKTTVYCPDLRNHGDSPHDPEHNYTAMTADILRFIEDQDIKSPVVIGHSMGAKAAMAFALSHPSSVSAVIPVDNGPLSIRLSAEFARYVEGMMAVDKAEVEHQNEMYDILKPYCAQLPVQQFLLSNFKRGDDKRYHCRLPLSILAKSLGHVADFDKFVPSEYSYKGPTLLIRGTKSSFVPDECLPLMGQLFPRFEVRDIDAGHWLISEKPKEFLDEVNRFLEKDE